MTRKFRTTWALLLAFLFSHAAAPAARADVPSETLERASSDVAPIDYRKFGTFQNLDSHDYRYVITDRAGLAAAEGSGIYPNDGDLNKDEDYRRLLRAGKLNGPLDKFRPEVDPVLAYYKWVSQKGAQNQGLRLYNIARSLEFQGKLWQALKAYHAVVVRFPKAVVWQGSSPWYIGVSALDSVYRLLDAHPEWDLALVGAKLEIRNGFDQKGTNDVFTINPGRWTDRASAKVERPTPTHARTLFQRGMVKFVRWSNGDWQILVHDRPFLIRGMSYVPTPVGKSPDFGYKTHADWMLADENKNGKADGPYDTWVDANGNNKRDPNEPVVGDFRLMSDMGVNTVRLYHQTVTKELLRDLADSYGIRVLMGDLVGAYTVGSGAAWEDGTDYANREQRDRMRQSVRTMVEKNKDEDYVLMWVLGNENNYGKGSNARKDPETYYKFVNSLARMVHILDPSRPVAICNGDLEFLDIIARECPDVDVLAVNAYRGGDGMGESFWTNVKKVWNRPVLISEFGCPAYNGEQSADDAQLTQANYLLTNWKDIEAHASGSDTGNALGGVVFEWVDEWWKSGPQYDAFVHDKVPQTKGPFHGGWIYEEWLGVTSNGDGENSPYLRQLRPAYAALKNGPWREPMNFLDAEVRNPRSRSDHEN